MKKQSYIQRQQAVKDGSVASKEIDLQSNANQLQLKADINANEIQLLKEESCLEDQLNSPIINGPAIIDCKAMVAERKQVIKDLKELNKELFPTK